jgi:hypothetical protein
MQTVLDMQTESPAMLTERFIEAIKAEAIKKWGEKRWVLELTRAYCEICQRHGDTTATVDNRRRSIARIFEVKGCNLETAIALAQCVDCNFQLACTRVEILPL